MNLQNSRKTTVSSGSLDVVVGLTVTVAFEAPEATTATAGIKTTGRGSE